MCYKGPTILVVKDGSGRLFGAHASTSWCDTQGTWLGNGGSSYSIAGAKIYTSLLFEFLNDVNTTYSVEKIVLKELFLVCHFRLGTFLVANLLRNFAIVTEFDCELRCIYFTNWELWDSLVATTQYLYVVSIVRYTGRGVGMRPN